MNGTWVYDEENFPNLFLIKFKNIHTKVQKTFRIFGTEENPFSDENEILDIIHFVRKEVKWLIGYNNQRYDNLILNYILKNGEDMYITDSPLEICRKLNELSHRIIQTENHFNDVELGELYNRGNLYKSIDLIRVCFEKIQRKSLKQVAVLLKHPIIQDLPLNPDAIVKVNELRMVDFYCANDVEITEKLFFMVKDLIQLRLDIGLAYGVNVLNSTKTGIADALLTKLYAQETKQEKEDFINNRTYRSEVKLKEIIDPKIRFETRKLEDFLNKLKNLSIKSGEDFVHNIELNGLRIDTGKGGLHSVDLPGKFFSNDVSTLYDCDVNSFYPRCIANLKIKPQHIDDCFPKLVGKLADDRVKDKKEGRKTQAEAKKIVINSGTFGRLGFENGWLYDEQAMFATTINCQLYLLVLIEKLIINGIKVISVNTDGILCEVLKSHEDCYFNLCKDWENKYNFTFEYTKYSMYVRTNVNSYLAVGQDGKIKQKNEFLTSLDLTKGSKTPKIIALALNEYFLNGNLPKQSIPLHNDIYDFCMSQKIDTDKYIPQLYSIKKNQIDIQNLQKTTRYYISTSGGTLVKKKFVFTEDEKKKNTNPLQQMFKGEKVTVFNNFIEPKSFSEYNVDYSYYIAQTQKIIDSIEKKENLLF